MLKPVVWLAATVVLAGCQALASIEPVQPWEKSTLALDTMKAGGSIPALGAVDQHVYTSKESVKGGTGIGGGGCGCN